MANKIQQIQEYINYNVNNLIKLDTLEFFNHLHSNYYNELDISFMEYFLSLCGKEHEFCVEQSKMYEFGLLKENDKSNNVRQTLTEQLLLNENEDFLMLLDVQQSKKRDHRGGPNGNKLEYVFTPYGLKMVL